MALATLVPLPFSLSGTAGGNTFDSMCSYTPEGGTDVGACLRVAGDGSLATISVGGGQIYFVFEETSDIPLTATINSVKAVVRHSAEGPLGDNFWVNGFDVTPAITGFGLQQTDPLFFTPLASTLYHLNIPPFVSNYELDPGTPFSMATAESVPTAINPLTGLAWIRADLYRQGDSAGIWLWASEISGGLPHKHSIDQIALVVDYSTTGDPPLWFYNPETDHFKQSATYLGPPWIEGTPSPTLLSVTSTSGT